MEVLTLDLPRKSSLARAKNIRTHHLPTTGLVIAAIAVAPLITFAILWAALLAVLGGMWILSVLGFY